MAWVEGTAAGQWRAVWRDGDGRKHSKSGFRTQAAASRYGGAEEQKARRSGVRDGRAPTWGEWRDTWLSTRRVEASTERQDVVRINRHLTPRWGKTRLDKITRRDVQAWVNQLADTPAAGRDTPLSPSTVDRILHLFSASMKAAVLDDRVPLAANPCTGIKRAPVAAGHERYLTRGEADLVAHYLNEPWRSAWLILLGTGLRFGEFAGLHWQRVDLDRGLLHVVETWDTVDRVVKPYPKSRKPRAVPIPDWLEPVLLRQAERQGKAAARSCGQRHAGGVRCRSGLVCPGPGGAPMDGHNFGQRDLHVAAELAGVAPLRLHDARHSYASWLRQAGVALEEIQRLLGHASSVTTQRYAALGESQYDQILAALNGTPISGS